MKNSGQIITGIVTVVMFGLFSGCNNVNQPLAENNLQLDTTWKNLTIREKIGQVMCLNYNKYQIENIGNGSISTFLDKYPVGSFFMANYNLSPLTTPDSLAQLYRSTISDLSKETKYPLLFVEDFESGVVSAIKGYNAMTYEMGLGATNSPELAYKYGEIVASEARSLGINWVLHPVSDLNINPFNYLTNVRALTDNPDLSVKLLPQQVKGIQSQHVAATAKHFPGDGTDFINQHFNTSAQQFSYEKWKQEHGRVFQTLIDSGIMTFMAGHIAFPGYEKEKLDGNYLPATLSHELLTNLLKGKMGFKGVIVSDALNMAGIEGYYKNQLETEIECFKAGADVLLWPSLEFMDTLEARINRNEIPMERLDDAVSRVWNLKKKLGLFEKGYNSIKPLSDEEMTKHREWAYEISKKSITLLSNKHDLLPLDTTTSKKILMVVISENPATKVFEPLINEMKNQGFEIDVRQNLSMFSHGSELKGIEKTYDKIIFAFYGKPGTPWGTLALNGDQALTMWSANTLPFNKVISIGFGDPYKNLIFMPRTWCRINCYNTDIFTQKALVELIMGKEKFEGISPVSYNKAALK